MTDIIKPYRWTLIWFRGVLPPRVSFSTLVVLASIPTTVCSMMYLGIGPMSYIVPWCIIAFLIATLVSTRLLVNERNRYLIQANETSAISNIGRIVSSSLQIDEVYEQFAAAVKTLVDFDRVNINIIDHDSNKFQLAYLSPGDLNSFTAGETFPLEGTATGLVCNARSTLIMNFDEHPEIWTSQRNLTEGFRSVIVLPLLSKDRVIGILAVFTKRKHEFGAREQAILEGLAVQIAPAIENADLYRQLQARSAEIAVVDEVARIITSTLDIDQVYEQFCAEVRKLVDFDRASIAIFNEARSEMITAYRSTQIDSIIKPGLSYPSEGTISARVSESRRTMVLGNLENHREIWSVNQFLDEGLHSGIVTPLMSGDTIYGTFSLFSGQTNGFGERERVIVERLANQIAPAVANAQLYEQLKSHAQEMAVVDEVARIITSNLDMDEVYERFFAEVGSLIEFDRASVNVIDANQGTLYLPYLTRVASSPFNQGDTIPLKGSITGLMANDRSTIIIDDLAEEVRLSTAETLVQEGFRSAIVTPMISKEEVIGGFLLLCKQPNAYGLRERTVLERLASQIAPAIENARLHEQVQDSEARFRHLFDDAPVGYAEIDVDGYITQVNRTELELLGYSVEEVVGHFSTKFVSEQERDASINNFNRIMAGEVDSLSAERTYKRKDGSNVDVLLEIRALHDQTGRVVGFRRTMQDITERKRAEERMWETARLASIGELASGVAHEINNPLASVLGFSQLLLASEAPEAIRSDIQKIFSEAQRAAKIVHNLLTFARKSDPIRRLMDINTILERALELKSADFNSTGIRISRNLSIEPLSSTVDDHQLTQVFLNILTNAQQAIESSGREGHISVRSSSSNGMIEVKITDNGVGIGPELIGKIFEPFFTTKPVGVGTGLGLSICYGIVQEHGGGLWVEDSDGEETTFHIEIPIVLLDYREASTEPDVLIGATTRHILVVDDEPNIRALLQKSLELERYTVDQAEDGQEAWRKLKAMVYDCVVLDLKMPVMGGQELYTRIYEVDESLAQKVLFITGDTATDTRDFLTATGRQVLHKPFDIQELLGQVKTLTGISKN